MRVLIVNDFTPGSPGSGGAEVVCARAADALRDRGHEVMFLPGDAHLPPPAPLAYIDSPRARRLLARELDAFAPEVVHLHNIYHRLSPGILATLARWKRLAGSRRVVMTLHDYHLVCPNAGLRYFRAGAGHVADPDRLRSLAFLLTRRWDHRGRTHSVAKLAQHLWNYRLLRRRRAIDALVAPSRFMADTVASVLGTACPPVAVIPNPIDPPPAIPERTHDAGRPFTLLFAGRVEPEKGLPPFIAHLRGVADLRLEIVGEGSDLEACRFAAREAGVDLVTPGRLSHADTLARLAQADAAVLPSLVPETDGMIVAEALSVNVPVLVTHLGAPPELVVDSGAGACFNSRDGGSVREALERIRGETRTRIDWEHAAALLQDRVANRHVLALEETYVQTQARSLR
jgi:glycosyltransferase involved in cell wall biosynthesis